MNVLILTVFLSLLLAALFLLFYVREKRTQGISSPEQDALRPFDMETPKAASQR